VKDIVLKITNRGQKIANVAAKRCPNALGQNSIAGVLLRKRELIVLVFLFVMAVYLQTVSQGLFLRPQNLIIMADRKAPEAFVTIGITYLLITKQFDLSVASVMAFSGAMTAWRLVAGDPGPLAFAAGLLVGIAMGALNGFLVTRLHIASFIATLGVMYIARSGAQVITQGSPIGNLPESFIDMGKLKILGLPWYFIVLVIAIAILQLLLKKQTDMYKLFYIGANDRSSSMVGISSDKLTWIMFVVSGFTAAFAGIILTAKSYSASPIAFDKMEMRYIAACVIGGASISGGQGSIVGSLLGFLLIVLIGNGMTLIGISPYWENVIFGTILAIAAIADAYSVRKQRANG
jgi:ribose/xylose/arabinose/galactoside ABC-type transport system permease subunit